MSVEKNLLFVNKDKILANKLLEMTNLKELKDRYPSSLSGGQKQRVSLCRAMMGEPRLLLLDEPLSALDPAMRTKLQDDILALHKEFGTTTLMVSHEPSEMYKLSNRVIIIKNGKIVKDGTPKEILLKTKGSQKFSFEGKIVDIIRVDILYLAIISIGQQLVEVVLDSTEANSLKVGDNIQIGTKAFIPTIKKV
jgi:molybdate transport system ATP-binding protein